MRKYVQMYTYNLRTQYVVYMHIHLYQLEVLLWSKNEEKETAGLKIGQQTRQ